MMAVRARAGKSTVTAIERRDLRLTRAVDLGDIIGFRRHVQVGFQGCRHRHPFPRCLRLGGVLQRGKTGVEGVPRASRLSHTTGVSRPCKPRVAATAGR